MLASVDIPWRDITQSFMVTTIIIVFDTSSDRWARNLRVMMESQSIPGKHNVGFVSITEPNLDYSTPMGKFITRTLGSIAELSSDNLGIHVSKGLSQRANEGKHTGGIPLGYESCWAKDDRGGKKRVCEPEHPVGIHVHPQEGPAASELFTRYLLGTTTLSQLAAWLNREGFRTRNMHRLPDHDGSRTSGPMFFTTASTDEPKELGLTSVPNFIQAVL